MPVTKPTKQRKMLFQAPDHIRHKHFAAHLSPELRTSHEARALPVRSGDTVRIMRGDHKGFEGKVTRIHREKYRIYVEGLTREKVDGTTIFVPIHPSKVMISRLNLDDKWRKKALKRKKEAHKRMEGIEEKPPEEVVEIKKEVIKEKVAIEEEAPKKELKRRKRKAARKPADKKIEEKPKKRKRVKKAKKKKAEEAKKEKPKAKKARAKRKTAKKTEGGT